MTALLLRPHHAELSVVNSARPAPPVPAAKVTGIATTGLRADHATKLVLVLDSHGFPLYFYSRDRVKPSASSCLRGQSKAVMTSGAKSQWSNTSASDAGTMIRLAEADICPAYLPKQTWHTIARFTGDADTTTSRFTIRGNGDWVLKYSYDCSAQLGWEGIFTVDEDAMNNDNPSAVAIDRLDSGRHGSWHVYDDAGRHYLAIMTECLYKITVVQKY